MRMRALGQAGLFVAALLLVVNQGMGQNLGQGTGQEKKVAEPHTKGDLNESLRQVINMGADLYNKQGDHAGCYRLFQGSLVAVKPFLVPELQQKIDTALTSAERLPAFSDRAFELRKVIDEIRIAAKTPPQNPSTPPMATPKVEVAPEEKKPETKLIEKKTIEEKKTVEPESKTEDKLGTVKGKITFEGKPLPTGNMLTLISEAGRRFSTNLKADGEYRFATPLAPGPYRAIIEPFSEDEIRGEIPARYRNAEATNLVIEVARGLQMRNLDLKK